MYEIPRMPSNGGRVPSTGGSTVNFWRMLVVNKKSSILARLSPKQTRRPEKEMETIIIKVILSGTPKEVLVFNLIICKKIPVLLHNKIFNQPYSYSRWRQEMLVMSAVQILSVAIKCTYLPMEKKENIVYSLEISVSVKGS